MKYLREGIRVKNLREKSSISQTELSASANVSPSLLCKVEKGEKKLSLDTIKKLSKALFCSMDHLVGDVDRTKVEDLLSDQDIFILFRKFSKMNSANKKHALDYIKYLSKRGD